MSTDDAKSAGKQRHRSPNYPLFDLKKAVERAQQLYDRDKTHKVPVTVLHDRWGYKPMSGALKQAIGALKGYGLITVEGEGDKRFVAVSDSGKRILLNASGRDELLKKAALGPALFNSLWAKYASSGIPSDDVLRHHLIFDRNFNDESVGDAIARFKATIEFSKLSVGDKMESGGNDEEDENSGSAEEDTDIEHDVSGKGRKEKRRMLLTDTKEFTYPFDEGPAVLTFPSNLSARSAEDLKDWLEFVLGKLKKATSRRASPSTHEDDDVDDENGDV